jgi:hypothetical protein
MIRIAITQATFDAIARRMPFGSVNFEAGVDANGERYIWLPRAVVDRLRALRGPGESFSDVILRLAAKTNPLLKLRVRPQGPAHSKTPERKPGYCCDIYTTVSTNRRGGGGGI